MKQQNKNNEELHKINEKAQYVEVYHTIMVSAEAFSLISPNVPKSFCEVIQHIHGRFDSALYYVYRASNTIDISVKLDCVNNAINDLFFQYTSLEYLVKTKAITVGAANQVIDNLHDSYEQCKKWLNYLRKNPQLECSGKTDN